MTTPHSVLDVHATLGEGPVWVAREQALWFVDIKQHKIHHFVPTTGVHHSYDAPCQVGWVLPCEDGKFIAGLQQGLARFDPATGLFDVIATPDGRVTVRKPIAAMMPTATTMWIPGIVISRFACSSARAFRAKSRSTALRSSPSR